MEPLHMNRLRDLLNRLRSGESERRIARDMHISRTTVRKYRELARTLLVWVSPGHAQSHNQYILLL